MGKQSCWVLLGWAVLRTAQQFGSVWRPSARASEIGGGAAGCIPRSALGQTRIQMARAGRGPRVWLEPLTNLKARGTTAGTIRAMAPPDSAQKGMRGSNVATECSLGGREHANSPGVRMGNRPPQPLPQRQHGVTRLGKEKAGRRLPLAAASRGWMHSGKRRW